MKIIKLQAENIKKIKAIEITPGKNLVQITGANAQGKTSVLDAIWYAIGGKEAIHTHPIRAGEEEGFVCLELDGLKITRKFKLNNNSYTTSLSVTNKEGAQYKSPQSILDALVGKVSFDPLAFTHLKPKEKFDLLRTICNISFDFEQAITDSNTIYAQRTLINRQEKLLKAELGLISLDSTIPDIEIDISAMTNKLSESICENELRRGNANKLSEVNRKEKAINEKIKTLEKELMVVRSNASLLKPQLKDEIDTRSMEEKIKISNEFNIKIRQEASKRQRKNTLEEEHSSKVNESIKLTGQIDKIASDKIAAIKGAKMPISALSIDDNNDILYKGFPLDQNSGAEQLSVSLAIAVATNPKLKVLRIVDGSLLDSAAMKRLEEFADSKDYQIWIERVDESGNVGICIEDGGIKNKATGEEK